MHGSDLYITQNSCSLWSPSHQKLTRSFQAISHDTPSHIHTNDYTAKPSPLTTPVTLAILTCSKYSQHKNYSRKALVTCETAAEPGNSLSSVRLLSNMDCWITATWPRDFERGVRYDQTLRFGTGSLSPAILPEYCTTTTVHCGMISPRNQPVDQDRTRWSEGFSVASISAWRSRQTLSK